MKITVAENYGALGRIAAKSVTACIKARPDMLLCAATGASPLGLYARLVRSAKREPHLFGSFRILKLDEWGGLPMDDIGTCEHYLQEKLLRPMQVSPKRYTGFHSMPDDPQRACDRMDRWLERNGPIDLCILGLGANGHLALNEPGKFLSAGAHIARLSARSLKHNMLKGSKIAPTFGLTLGMGNIIRSRRIILLVSGRAKKEIWAKIMSKEISAQLPASFLWLHPDVHCIVEKDLMPDGR